jgi:HNH endonuclease
VQRAVRILRTIGQRHWLQVRDGHRDHLPGDAIHLWHVPPPTFTVAWAHERGQDDYDLALRTLETRTNPPSSASAMSPQIDRAARLEAAIERDGPTCFWCGRTFGDMLLPTTEHLVPRVKGGPSWLENEVAACLRCNRERGHLAAAEWIDECWRRGWQLDIARVMRLLVSLAAAIEERGGRRRARPHLDSQLRRLARM